MIDGKLVRDIADDDKANDVTSLWRNMAIGENQEIDQVWINSQNQSKRV